MEVIANQPFAFVTYTLADPDRLVIDPVEPGVSSFLPKENLIEAGIVHSWSLVQTPGEGEDQLDYLSIELNEPVEHRIESASDKLVIQIRSKEPLAPANAVEIPKLDLESAMKGDYSSPEPVIRFNPSGTEVWNLEKFVNLSLGRHRNIRIAKKEIRLAEMKVAEARRGLFPSASLKGSWTEGTASLVDFQEYNTGLEVEQPLYNSGRLLQTYQQALVNFQIAEKRLNKTQADLTYDMAEAYYQWVGAKKSLQAQEGLVQTLEDILGRTQTRSNKNLVTRLELLNVEAQANQAKFQRATAVNDVELARIKFLKRLNLDRHSPLEVPDDFSSRQIPQVEVEEALKLATIYRPDIQVNRLTVEFQEFEERIAKAKGKLRLDLSGFLGASASAFETESLQPGEDYFVGLKATRAWGPHETVFSWVDTHTSARLGQTTRTDSTVYSGELNLFSQLQGLSEVQQAQVNLEKAQRDLEQVQGEVFQEVEEATLSFEKARMQLEYARQKIGFRLEQVKIMEIQVSLNEALPSQLVEARMKLTEERVGETQAWTNLHVALARLNKAVGLPNHYT